MTSSMKAALGSDINLTSLAEEAKVLPNHVGTYHPGAKAGVTIDPDGTIAIQNQKGGILILGESGGTYISGALTAFNGLHVLSGSRGFLVDFCPMNPIFLSPIPFLTPITKVLTTPGLPAGEVVIPPLTTDPGGETPHFHTLSRIQPKNLFGFNQSFRLSLILDQINSLLG